MLCPAYAYAMPCPGCYLNSHYYKNDIRFFWNNSTCQENIVKSRIKNKEVQKEVDKASLDGQSLPSNVLQTTKLSLPKYRTSPLYYTNTNTSDFNTPLNSYSTNRSFNTNPTNLL